MPATSDPNTSDAVQFAKKYDKEQERTLVVKNTCFVYFSNLKKVVTKPDVGGKDTEKIVKSLLAGQLIKSKLGFVCVKNRSTEDIDNGVSIEESLKREQAYFQNHHVYGQLDPHCLGIKNLTAKLMSILKQRYQ